MKKLFVIITALMLLTAVKAQNTDETPALSELMLISQPVMQLKNGSSKDYLTFYFDIKNIGAEKYKGEIMLIFEPDFEHFYAKEKIKVPSGKTRRVTFDVDVNKIYYDSVYNVVPVYYYDNQWYQLTNYEAFDSLFVCLAHPDLQSVVDAAPCYVTNYYYIERPPHPFCYHFGAWYWGGYYDYYGGRYHYHYHYHKHIHYYENPQTPSEPAEPVEPVPPVTPAEPVTPAHPHDQLYEAWNKIKERKKYSPANPYYNSSATITPAAVPTRTTNSGSYLTTPTNNGTTTTTNSSTTTNTKPATPKYNNSTTFTTPATSHKNTVTPAKPARPSTPTTPAKPTTSQWNFSSPATTTTRKNTVTPATPSKPSTPTPAPAPRPTVTPNNSSTHKTSPGNVTPSKPSTPPTPSHKSPSSSKSSSKASRK